MKTKKTKFIEGFLAGFIIGLFVYFVVGLSRGSGFSIIWALVFSLTPAFILGFLLTIEKSKPLKPEQAPFLSPDFDKGQTFKLTKTRWPSKYLAIGSFVLGLLSLVGFNLVFTSLAFILGLAALVKVKKECLNTKFKILAILGVLFSLISIAVAIYRSYRTGTIQL